MVKYTDAQVRAYYKKKFGKAGASKLKKAKGYNKKKPIKKVIKQNQQRVEYKDRVSAITTQAITAHAGDDILGPENSLIVIPTSLTHIWSQGSSNGMVDGLSFNPRFLNMKIRLDFSSLPGEVTVDAKLLQQKYDIYVRQCWIQQDVSEFLVDTATNAYSHRTEPAFIDGDIDKMQLHYDHVAKRTLFNAKIQPDFLSYERRVDDKVKVIKTMHIKPQYTENVSQVLDQNARPRNLSFNWKMPNRKTRLSPMKNITEIVAPSQIWIPCVLITLDRTYGLTDVPTPLISESPLIVEVIDHFTYTDT